MDGEHSPWGRYLTTSLALGLATLASPSLGAAPHFGVEYSFFSQNDVSVNSPEFVISVGTGAVELQAHWGFAVVDNAPPLDSEVIAFNPHLSATSVWRLHSVDVSLGLGATVPVSSPYGSDQGELARSTADVNSAMRGGYNLFLYAPDTFAINLLMAAATDSGPVRFGADITPFLLISTGDRSADAEGIGVQFGVEAILSALPILDLGVRSQLVGLPSGYADGRVQLAVEPFVRATLGSIYAQVGLVLNLLDGYGWAFDDDGVYGLGFGLGLRI